MQDPIGAESVDAIDWTDSLSTAASEEWIQRIVDDTRGVQALLFGRRTYEFFAGRYSGSTNAVAELVSSIPKYVVSSTLTDASWTKTTVLSGDATTEVAKLKADLDGTIVIWASSRLVRELVEHDLVDELRLVVFSDRNRPRRTPFRRHHRRKTLAPRRNQHRRRPRLSHLSSLTRVVGAAELLRLWLPRFHG